MNKHCPKLPAKVALYASEMLICSGQKDQKQLRVPTYKRNY